MPPPDAGDGCSCCPTHSTSRHTPSRSNAAIAEALASSLNVKPDHVPSAVVPSKERSTAHAVMLSAIGNGGVRLPRKAFPFPAWGSTARKRWRSRTVTANCLYDSCSFSLGETFQQPKPPGSRPSTQGRRTPPRHNNSSACDYFSTPLSSTHNRSWILTSGGPCSQVLILYFYSIDFAHV